VSIPILLVTIHGTHNQEAVRYVNVVYTH